MNNLSKKERLLQYRRQSRLPKYDLAVKNTNSGFQQYDYSTYPGFQNTPGEDISGDINTLSSNILPSALSTAVKSFSLPGQLKDIGTTLYKDVFGKSLVNNATNSALSASVGAMGAETTKQIAQNGIGNISTQAVGQVGKAAAQQSLEESAKQGAKTIANIGAAANIAAGAYGLYDLTNSILGMSKNTRSSQDMIDATSTQTDMRNGISYQRIGGINPAQEGRYANAQNVGDTIGNTVKGAGTGFAIGSVFPGLGNVIGAGIGALVGGIGSIFGGAARRRKVNHIIDYTNLDIANRNKQNESVAASQGLRNQFYQNNYNGTGMLMANRGFNPSTQYNKNTGLYREVWTPEGKQFGEQGSWVGKGESQINYDNGTASIVKEGTVGVDNQPSSAKEGDNITIAGNDVDWSTGNTFAKEVAPYANEIEKINKKEIAVQNSKASDKTKEINMFNLRKAKEPYLIAAKQYTDRQQAQHQIEHNYEQYNCGKPRYDLGKIAQYIPYALNLNIANKRYNTYKNSIPSARQSYVPNQYMQSALDTLGSLYYDPTPELNVARDAYRQGLYMNNNNGSLSAGQRAAINATLNTGLMKNRADALSKAQQMMNEYRKVYANAALQAGAQEAARQQQSLAAYNDQLASSYANRLKGMETADNSKSSAWTAFAKHLFDQSQSDRAFNIQNKWLRMYDNPDALGEYRAAQSLVNNMKKISPFASIWG